MSHCFPPLSVYVQLLELTNQDITWEQRRAIFFSNKPCQESASCFEPLRKLWLVSILNFLHFSMVSVYLMIPKWVFKLIFSSEIMIMTIRLKDWISNIVYNVEESKVFRVLTSNRPLIFAITGSYQLIVLSLPRFDWLAIFHAALFE